MTIITPPEELRPASTRLQRQHVSITPALRAKLVVVFTEARAEGIQGRYKGRKAQAIQEEDKIRGKAMDKKRSYSELITYTSLLN